MLRIAHVISARNFLGGAERIVRALLRAGDESGWQQKVLNPFAVGETTSAIVEKGSSAVYEAHQGDRFRDLPKIRKWLGDRLVDFAPDVVHVHLFHASLLTSTIGDVGEGAVMLTHHHGDIYQASARRGRFLLDRFATRRYGTVVAVSEAVGSFLVNEYGVSPSRLVTIRNGWEGEPCLDIPKSSYPTVVSVGNLRPEKDQATLLHAFASVRDELPAAKLVIVGDGPLRGSLESLTRRLGLNDTVTFVGVRDDIWPILAAGHVFTLSSTAEPLGIAAMEAMAAGLPVVATRVGGLTEVVDDGATGFLVGSRDPSSLGSALTRLLKDEGLAREMGERGRAAAEDMRMSEMTGRYGELYQRLVASRP